MKQTDLEIRIPAEIAILKLAINEKIVLAHVAKFPGCSNARLAKLIGATCRCVEDMLHRLRQQGYIQPSGKGRARRHYLTFHVEHHAERGNKETTSPNVKSHKECGVQPSAESPVEPTSDISLLEKEIPLADDFDQTMTLIQAMFDHRGIFPEAILNHYRRILKRIENEAPESAAKDAAVRELRVRVDAFVAICYVTRMPKQYHFQALRLIGKARPEKLARFRQQVEAGQLDSKAPLLLTALGDDSEVVAGAVA